MCEELLHTTLVKSQSKWNRHSAHFGLRQSGGNGTCPSFAVRFEAIHLLSDQPVNLFHPVQQLLWVLLDSCTKSATVRVSHRSIRDS